MCRLGGFDSRGERERAGAELRVRCVGAQRGAERDSTMRPTAMLARRRCGERG